MTTAFEPQLPQRAPDRSAVGAVSIGDLSPREIEVLRLIAAGHSNEEIAAELSVTINTAKSHIKGAYRKVGVTSRSQAVLWGLLHGLFPRT